MRIGFVYSEMESLGLESLSSYLKAQGHQTRLFFDPQLFDDTVSRNGFLAKLCDYKNYLLAQIEDWKPDLLAFSVLSTNYGWAIAVASRVKEKFAIPVVFGGIHPTLAPREVIAEACVDFVVRGEGEETLADLANNLGDVEMLRKVPGLWSKKGGGIIENKTRPIVEDLDKLPFPDKDLFYRIMPYLSRHYTIITGRGCPHACTFCCNHALRQISRGGEGYLRRRSPQNVIKELLQAKSRYKIEDVFFDDSTFTYDREWLREFSRVYKDNIGLRSFCWVHPAEVTEETVSFLGQMNCQAVEMGVESLNPQIRAKWLRRHHSNAQIEEALGLLKKHRIFCVTDNIIGLPEETVSDLENMVEFYNRTRPEKTYVFELRTFPHTDMFSLYREYSDKCGNSRAENLPFTLSAYRGRIFKQIEMLLLMVQFLPPRMVSLILRKKWYRFFPACDMYNLLEIIPYLIRFFRREKRWFPIRGTRHRYIFFGIKKLRRRLIPELRKDREKEK